MKIQTTKYISTLMLSLLLASCVTSKYETPNIIDNKLYRDSNSTDSTSIADISWKNYFQDSTLQSLIDEGLKNNYDLQIATARIKQTEANLSSAKLSQLPTLDLGAQYTSSKLNDVQGNGITTHSDVFQLSASASWELDIWGKLNSNKKSALATYLQSEAYKRVVQTSLVANIASNYYSLLALDKQLEITNSTIELLKENVVTMQYLKDADITTGAAVEQSKALLYSTQVTVPDLEKSIREMENSICLLLGREPGRIERTTIAQQPIPTELKYGVPAQLLSKRPDVQMYEYAYRAAFENTNISKASLYPSLTITGAAGYSTLNNLDHFFDYSSLFANVVGGLTQPIFNQKKLRNQLKMNQAKQEEALINFKNSVLNAGNEVSNALFAYTSAKSKDMNRGLQVESLIKSVDYTKELLAYSNANYTEVLDAEENLLSAQLNQVNDKLQQLKASVDLYRALGGGVN